jgi:predicted DCC family thiol-disulfide oxidoreductase YuxK
MKPVPAPDGPDGLILFDGVCLFCSRWVRWLIRQDAARRFRFATVQSDIGGRLARAVGIDPEAPQSNVLFADGQALFKSDASLAVLSSLPGWRWTRALIGAPRPWRDWVYDRIANNRYRLFGRSDVCWIPDAEIRERFEP